MKSLYIALPFIAAFSFVVFHKCQKDESALRAEEQKQAERLDFVRKNAEKKKKEELDHAQRAMNSAIELNRSLQESEAKLEASKREYEDARLQNIEKLRRAEMELQKLMGE